MNPRLDPLLLVRKDDLEELKDHQASETVCDNFDARKEFHRIWKSDYYFGGRNEARILRNFDRLLAEFDRRFTDNLPVLSKLETLDHSSTKFMDIELLRRFSALYGELDIDDILLESQAGKENWDFGYNPQHSNEDYFHRRIVYLNKKVSRWEMPACSLVEFSTFSLIT